MYKIARLLGVCAVVALPASFAYAATDAECAAEWTKADTKRADKQQEARSGCADGKRVAGDEFANHIAAPAVDGLYGLAARKPVEIAAKRFGSRVAIFRPRSRGSHDDRPQLAIAMAGRHEAFKKLP